MSRPAIIIGALLVLAAGAAVYAAYSPAATTSPFAQRQADRDVVAPLINPTVTAGIGKHFIVNFQPLREQFLDVQKRYSQKTYIYFSYLNNASWVGINERDNFVAASTVKVPLAIAVYKAVEDGRLSLDQQYTVAQTDLDEAFGDFYKTALGKTYSVHDLLRVMLEQSDNTAKNALLTVLANIGITNPMEQVYETFGWSFDFGVAPDYRQINTKILANMFLSLYNAQYLNIPHSQEVLQFLDNSQFDDMIVAGVPQQVRVAHKVGIAVNDETFSDCGIVYAPNRPYILCLGSNGGNQKIAARFMAEVSEAAYRYVINN